MNNKVAQDIIGFIIRQIKLLKNIKNVRVTWFGGEPLLSYDIIVSFSNVLKAKLRDLNVNYQSNMITNGLLLTKDKIECLVKQCNLKYVQITLDGFKETYSKLKQTPEESFNIVVSNIINASFFAKVTIRLNTNKANYNEMKCLAKYLIEDCGLKNKVVIYLAEIRDYNNKKSNDSYRAGEFLMARHEFKQYLFDNKYIDYYKMAEPPCFEPNFCGIIKKYNYAIGPNGELYKCEHYFGDKRKIVGDIYNGLYYNEEYKKFIEGCSDIQCINCNLAPCCRSDCGAMYECHKRNGDCLIYNDLLKNLKSYVKEFVTNRIKK